jgi:hypothetical protein
LTAARLATIRRAGVAVTPIYASLDAGVVGKGCLSPGIPDEIHLFHDLLAMIQPTADDERPGLSRRALLVSSLRETAPLTLLNVSLGDQGTLTERRCGCPLERLGWGTHLHTIRSFEKLTAGGMTLLDVDVVRVLEESLPARFGGGPTDYQLVEDEVADGQPRLRLLVHPDVGPLAPEKVEAAFLEAIGQGSGPGRVFALAWRAGDVLRVERRAPFATQSGKILHVRANP